MSFHCNPRHFPVILPSIGDFYWQFLIGNPINKNQHALLGNCPRYCNVHVYSGSGCKSAS